MGRAVAILLSVLFLALPVHAEDRLAWMGPMMVGSAVSLGYSCATDVCSGCTIQERGECGSTTWGGDSDNEEAFTVISGSVDANYTTTVLQGNESIYYASSTDDTRTNTVAGTDSRIYVAMKLRMITGASGSAEVLKLRRSGAASMATVLLSYQAGGYWRPRLYYNLLASNCNDTADEISIPNATNYHLKLEYDNGSGSDGQYKMCVSPDPFTSWTCSTACTITNSTDTDQAVSMESEGGSSSAVIIDDVRWDDADITY